MHTVPGVISYQNISASTIDNSVTIIDTAKVIMFSIAEYNDVSGEFTTLNVSDFDGYDIRVVSDITERVDALENTKDNIVTRNQDKLPMLTASCRFRKTSANSKDFQLLVVADSHGDRICLGNGVTATNGFAKIDALIHVGDCVANLISIGENVDAEWKNLVSNSDKPCFFVIGNHEKGTYPLIYGNPSDEQLYNSFIKPMVDNGWLISGEYTENKCYWYHDFSSYSIRIIAIDEYEPPFVLDDTNWEAITYDNTLTSYGLTFPSSFAQGDKINVDGYTDYSFRAKNNISNVLYYNNTVPSYKYRRGYRWISQTQAQWFLDTLASTPNGYKIIVACHNPYSAKADVEQTRMFSQKNNWVNGHGMQNYMTNDFIADAINAFVTKDANFSTTCSSGLADMPDYVVSKDFSAVVGTFHSLLGGHVHEDCVWKHQDYIQYQITPICTNSNYYAQSSPADIRRSDSSVSNILDVDCLTVVSYGESRLGLVKIGVNITEDGDKRDFEIIDISE